MFGKVPMLVEKDQVVEVWMARQSEYIASAKNLKYLPEIGHGMHINGHNFRVVDISHVWVKEGVEVHVFVERK